MQIISHIEGYFVWHASWDELAPDTGIAFPLLTEYLKSTFDFQTIGMSATGQQAGMVMPMAQVGQVVSYDEGESHRTIPVFNLEFQPDRVILGSTRTDLAEEALATIMARLQEDLGFRIPEQERHITYRTSLVFDPETELETGFGRFAALTQATNLPDGSEIKPFGVRFSASMPGGPDQLVVIERRVPAPANQDWWFIQAPFDLSSTHSLLRSLLVEETHSSY